ncbi:hypothetical protein [Tabrizicola flagellatus]|uniref:hypothetical protein n=1 Tax=Tabrizicola flagellatus TaxID=2593021 RepID=UPI0011F3E3A5|nr:hypothetical protein [Tabrizicola flagellatus]
MPIWMSGRFDASLTGKPTGRTATVEGPVSHDDIFSRAPGMLDLTTAARKPVLDVSGTRCQVRDSE